VPIGCLGAIDGGECTIDGLVTELDGERAIRRSIRGKASGILSLAETLADTILDEGGAEILDAIRSER
jgi:porphobilinogen deaminase